MRDASHPGCLFPGEEARIPALLSAALVALSFPLIDYSQEARAYSLLVLLVALSATFSCAGRGRQPGALFGTLATCLLAFYTHFGSVFWIGPAVMGLLWLGRRQMVGPLALTAILAVPELLRISRYPSEGFVWLAQATPLQAADTLSKGPIALSSSRRPAASGRALLIGWRACPPGQDQRLGASKSGRGAGHRHPCIGANAGLAVRAGARPVFMTRTILIGMPGAMLAIALLLKFEQRIADSSWWRFMR